MIKFQLKSSLVKSGSSQVRLGQVLSALMFWAGSETKELSKITSFDGLIAQTEPQSKKAYFKNPKNKEKSWICRTSQWCNR